MKQGVAIYEKMLRLRAQHGDDPLAVGSKSGLTNREQQPNLIKNGSYREGNRRQTDTLNLLHHGLRFVKRLGHHRHIFVCVGCSANWVGAAA